ncbi:hypothetical protein BDV25DRAFT_150195 [Aspergillus avenaceus]|uniref:Uncharacterized protein n=1 Tax=Aspergillus avenaceus TaxID=36643 RepID=A0A5N6U3D2_ASPAV|nr:hypothetical protein BDV25DRAFT_150195 [Aspergillus avenaceus]
MAHSCRIMEALPPGYVLIVHHGVKHVQKAAKDLYDHIREDPDGNQYMVVLGMTPNTRYKLDNDKNILDGVPFRFQWEEDTGLIKVIPGWEHDQVTDRIRGEIQEKCRDVMRLSKDDYSFGGTTTHRPPGGNRGKQPDQCLWPRTRLGERGVGPEWPTLVIETGGTESLPRLHEDVKWWFENSRGDVRIGLVVKISLSTRKSTIEKWQLASPGPPRPVTRGAERQLPHLPPPRVQQAAAEQQPFIAQVITISDHTVIGAPLVLNFHAVMDRRPQRNERDIELDADDLLFCFKMV